MSEQLTGSRVRAALVKAQGEMKAAKKNANNPHFNSSYADLDDDTEVLRPIFAKNGLGWRHDIWSDKDGVYVRCIIFHESGEEIVPENAAFLPIPKKDPQAYTGGFTYGKRSTLEAASGLSTTKDDDGNAASAKVATAAQAPEQVDGETGEVVTASGEYGPVIDWGKDKGKHASELDRRGLSFHVQADRKTLSDPSKKNFHAKTKIRLEGLLAVARTKGWASAEEAVQ